MAVLPGSDEERALAALVAAAGKVLGRDNREVPEDFIAGLFALAAPEDIMRYDPRQLAGLAASAWSFMAVREPGAPKLRFEAFEAGPESRQRESVLEIVNDDMPFLVDSILAELSERGIDIRLIVHPVFGVARDASGRLTAFKGPRAPVPACCERASSTSTLRTSTRRRAAHRSSRVSSSPSPMSAPRSRTGVR